MAMDLVYKTVGAVLAPFRYAQREIENTKESLEEGAKKAIYSVLKFFVMIICAILFLLFGSIATAIAVNENMSSTWYGFAVVAGIFLLLAACLYTWVSRK